MSKHAQRRMRQPTRSQTSSSGPPRDVNDVKCANCNEKGHTAQQCKRPKVESKDRKCHTCGLPGHIAAKCPDKDKRRAKANVVENEKREESARVPLFTVRTDDECQSPTQVTIGDVPVRPAGMHAATAERAEPECLAGASSASLRLSAEARQQTVPPVLQDKPGVSMHRRVLHSTQRTRARTGCPARQIRGHP